MTLGVLEYWRVESTVELVYFWWAKPTLQYCCLTTLAISHMSAKYYGYLKKGFVLIFLHYSNTPVLQYSGSMLPAGSISSDWKMLTTKPAGNNEKSWKPPKNGF
jgi:hypothetical protein